MNRDAAVITVDISNARWAKEALAIVHELAEMRPDLFSLNDRRRCILCGYHSGRYGEYHHERCIYARAVKLMEETKARNDEDVRPNER